jgi:hypothetical protein
VGRVDDLRGDAAVVEEVLAEALLGAKAALVQRTFSLSGFAQLGAKSGDTKRQ